MAFVSSYKVMGLIRSIYMHKTIEWEIQPIFHPSYCHFIIKCIQFIFEGLLEVAYVYQ
jgi:hypothetical protein